MTEACFHFFFYYFFRKNLYFLHVLLILIIQTRFPWHYLQSCSEILFFFFLSLSFPLHVFGKISRKTTMKVHENYPDSPTRIPVLWKKIFTPNGTFFFFFSSGRKEGVKRSNNFVSVQHCCIKEPHKNKRKFSVKGNLQPIPKINKMEWKIQNLSITLTVKYSNFNRLPFKYKLILCYNMYNAQLSGL